MNLNVLVEYRYVLIHFQLLFTILFTKSKTHNKVVSNLRFILPKVDLRSKIDLRKIRQPLYKMFLIFSFSSRYSTHYYVFLYIQTSFQKNQLTIVKKLSMLPVVHIDYLEFHNAFNKNGIFKCICINTL